MHMAQADSEMKIRILQAAKSLFAKQGYDGTSIRQICEEAGANVALVSYYFGGKEKVYQALLESFIMVRRLLELDEQLQKPVEGVRLLIKELTRFQMNDPELSCIIHQEFAKSSPRTLYVRGMTLPIWTKMRELLELGREQGAFRYEALDHTLVFTMGAVLSIKKRPNLHLILSGQESSAEQIEEHTCRFIMRALGAEGFEE
jgi:AcrR family transcriptional regulator